MNGLKTSREAPTQAVVRLEHVDVSFSGKPVLQDVSFEIGAGELVGILGPNGAGKTTLIRTILGLLPVDNGRLTGSALERGQRIRIGYVPQRQEARWEYPITVEEVVMASLKPKLLARASQWRAVYEALDAVGMREFRSRPIAALSGGQRQRVLIARALAPKPSLLLLDEPFTGLDEPNQEALARLYVSLKERGISILMSTHDLVQAANMCDRFILLNRSVRGVGALHELGSLQLWANTYEVEKDSALVRAVGALTGANA